MMKFMILSVLLNILLSKFTCQSAGAEEYTDCFSAEE